jgi:hypothetical protein
MATQEKVLGNIKFTQLEDGLRIDVRGQSLDSIICCCQEGKEVKVKCCRDKSEEEAACC